MRKAQEDLKEKAAMSSRRQRTKEERQFLQDGEGAVVDVTLRHRHSAEPLLWAETSTRQRLIFAGTELTYVDVHGSILFWLLS